jgi:N-acetyl sugar amidotransferase
LRYCARCFYPANHPLGITFDERGVCSGCRVHEEKDSLDWGVRAQKLQRIADHYRNKTRTIHDCIVPISGARDSYFIVHYVKTVLRLNPLVVYYNKQYNTPIGIRQLAYLRSDLGCDAMAMTVSPERVRRITRVTIDKLGSIYWHVIAGQTVFPVQVAVRFKIPLIIWGAHQGLDQVGMFSHLDEIEMTRKYRKEHDLMGVEAEDLVGASNTVAVADVEQFIYPHDRELEQVGVRGIYLGNYVRWDSKAQHEEMIRRYGYETAVQQRTFDTYSDVDCFHYSGLHDAIKFRKWGYGKVTDHATRELRLKRLSREAGLALIRQHETLEPKDTALFLSWIGMDADEFWRKIDEHRDPAIWHRTPSGAWERRDHVANHMSGAELDDARLSVVDDCRFLVTRPRDTSHQPNAYTLIGRGWVDRQ